MLDAVEFRYSIEKDEALRAERGIGFKEIIAQMQKGGQVLEIYPNPSPKYPNQFIAAVNVKNYVYQVAFVQEKDGGVFLKTLYPSRKATKKYLEEL
jgi:hypothetical protein